MGTVIHYPHITIDTHGTARIGRTRYKVLHLAAEHYHHGWSAEELLRQHTDLRPEEVYVALAYFYDHRDDLIQQMDAEVKEAEQLRPNPVITRAELLARRERAN